MMPNGCCCGSVVVLVRNSQGRRRLPGTHQGEACNVVKVFGVARGQRERERQGNAGNLGVFRGDGPPQCHTSGYHQCLLLGSRTVKSKTAPGKVLRKHRFTRLSQSVPAFAVWQQRDAGEDFGLCDGAGVHGHCPVGCKPGHDFCRWLWPHEFAQHMGVEQKAGGHGFNPMSAGF